MHKFYKIFIPDRKNALILTALMKYYFVHAMSVRGVINNSKEKFHSEPGIEPWTSI